MCYDIRSKLKTQKERYEYWRHKNGGKVKSLDIFGNDIFHASGFSHPSLLIYTNQAPYEPVQSTWGLVPTTTSTWNHTLNASVITSYSIHYTKLYEDSPRIFVTLCSRPVVPPPYLSPSG